MRKELEKLTTKQLIELVETFEHYPAVTLKDGKDYILSYLEDEACTISKKEIAEYLLNNNVEITDDNIHLYYEFMSDEDLERNEKVIYHKLMNRASLVQLPLFLTPKDLQKNAEYKNSILTIFGIKDTLKPIDEYIAEIKDSEQYKIYISNNALNIDFNDIKIAYNACNYVCGGGNYYRQRIKVTKEIFDFFIKKINEKLKNKLAYGDHTMLPEKGKYSEKEFSLNISTASFIKSLLPENLQKRFKLDVNSYLYVENGIKEKIFFRV